MSQCGNRWWYCLRGLVEATVRTTTLRLGADDGGGGGSAGGDAQQQVAQLATQLLGLRSSA